MRRLLKILGGGLLVLMLFVALVGVFGGRNQNASPQPVATTAAVAASVNTSVTYLETVGRIANDMSASMDRFAALMETPHIGDDAWTVNVATELAIWGVSYAEARALTPPASYTESHALFVDALRLYDEAGRDVARGIDALDATMIAAAGSKIAQAGDLITDANAALLTPH